MKIKKLLITINFISIASLVKADSPLTSTNFSDAYLEEAIVKQAVKTEGKLTTPLMEYLYNKANPIQVKLALINKVGWDFDGNNNAALFYDFLKGKNKKLGTYEGLLKKGTPDLLICMAYIQALGNYFNVDDALQMAEKGAKKNKKSYAIQLIYALIKAQHLFNTSWCEVYRATHSVQTNITLNKDRFNDQAISIIFEYMDLYKDSCAE